MYTICIGVVNFWDKCGIWQTNKAPLNAISNLMRFADCALKIFTIKAPILLSQKGQCMLMDSF